MSNPGPTFTPGSGGLRRNRRRAIGTEALKPIARGVHQERAPPACGLTWARLLAHQSARTKVNQSACTDRCRQAPSRVSSRRSRCPMMRSMTRRIAGPVAFAVAATAALVSTQTQSAVSWSPTLEELASPAGRTSGQPQISASPRGLVLSWIEGAGQKASLRFAERTAGGWSAAREVASGSDWFVNWADVPSVVRLASGDLVAHWLQKSGHDTYAYDVRLSYSKNNGKTWSTSFTPHSDGSKTEHGFASLFQMAGAGLGLVWLDGRAMTPESGHGSHGAGGAMSVRFATFDAGWKQTSEIPVDLRVCECCPTTTAVTSDGPIAAFRNRTDDEIRDIYISRFENGNWTEPKPVHQDGWKINACPVNGPMLSARGRDVAVAWFTVKEDQGRAFAAFSQDAGRTFGGPIRLDDNGS